MSKHVQKQLENDFKSSPDFVKKTIKLNNKRIVYIYFLESIAASDKVSDYITMPLTRLMSAKLPKNIEKLVDFLPGPSTKFVENIKDACFYLTNGFTIVFTNYSNEILAIETKAELDRSISPPESQSGIFGPKDAFSENYQKNVGLIKRRLKSKSLNTEEMFIGRRTATKIGIMYFSDIADISVVNKLKKQLSKIDTDGIIDSAYILHYLTGEVNRPLPVAFSSERPDRVSQALLEGKVAIIVDTSPFVIILPSFLIDFINPVVDNYTKSININFLKILRFLCFLITIMTPAIYIALTNYNAEAIPTSLLLNFSIQRDGVPFPTVIECLIALFTIEILKESDSRFPSSYGSAVSILGALVLGEAAISAGIVSPIMIIIAAITFITSLIFTDQELVNGIRHYRLMYLFFGAVLGLFGIVIATMFFLAKLTSMDTFGKPYTYPLAPYDRVYFFKSFFKGSKKKDKFRSSMLVKKDKTK